MSNKLRRVPLAPEMHAFEAEVGRDQGLVAGRNAKHGAIVAYTCDNGPSNGSCRPFAREMPNF